MNPQVNNIYEMFKKFIDDCRINIDLTYNQEMADIYEVSTNDIVCLDGGVYLVRIFEQQDDKQSIKFLVDKEVYYPGSYWDPPDADVANILTTESLMEAVRTAVNEIINCRIDDALLYYWETEIEDYSRELEQEL